ncbi:MAG: thiamine diphosphokinase [Pseudomonadota bacterium]
MTRVVVLLGGDIAVTKRLAAQVQDCPAVAADGGIRHAKPLGIEGNLTNWVGDFDSSSAHLQTRYVTLPRHAYAAQKDMTDGELAMALALEKGATDLVLVGAFGGRTDHAFAHLIAAPTLPCPFILTSGREEALLIKGTITPDWPVGTVFSILALDALTGVSITNAQWPLDCVSVSPGSGLTLSNVTTGPVTISCATGRALAIAQFDETP